MLDGDHPWPLLTAQSNVWLAERIGAPSPVYNSGEYIEIHGPIDPVLFEAALRQTVSEADALHTRFIEDRNGLCQLAGSQPDWRLTVVDLSGNPDARAAAKEWMQADLANPADPAHGELFAHALFKISADVFFWYQRYNHVVMDAYGWSLIAQRVAELYTALAMGLPHGKSVFGSLRSLLEEESIYHTSEQYSADREFWLNRFGDRPDPVRLPGGSAASSNGLRRSTAHLGAAGLAALREASRQVRASWSRVVIASSAAYLCRMSGVRDAVFSIPVTGRVSPLAGRTPGMLANMLPIRFTVRPDNSISELTRHVSNELRQVLKHQRFRGEELHRELSWPAGGRRLFGPVINIMTFDRSLSFAGYSATAHDLSVRSGEDLSIIVQGGPASGSMQIDFEAASGLYGGDELAGHQRSFLNFLEVVAADPGVRVSGVGVLDAGERHAAVAGWNETGVPVPAGTLAGLFGARAAGSPGAAAVVCGGVSWSYAELDAAANRVAHVLRGLGAGRECRVGVVMERSVQLVAVLVGVVKSGAAYVPVDSGGLAARGGVVLGE